MIVRTFAGLWDLCQRSLRSERDGLLLEPPAPDQVHLRLTAPEILQSLSAELHEQGFYLVTMVGTDERELLDGRFKVTYVFSHPQEHLFLILEQPVGPPSDQAGNGLFYYPYPERYRLPLDPFRRELADLFGLQSGIDPDSAPDDRPGSWLHPGVYPPDLNPLRRDHRTSAAIAAIKEGLPVGERTGFTQNLEHGEGEWVLTVGPVHAGVIEPGRFAFRLAGEEIEALDIFLGYTHKGIEHLFQTEFSLETGWQLAERVAGDSSFSHTLAYCRAVEALAGVQPPWPAQLLRGIFLEIERLANHIGDCAALLDDLGFGVPAAELGYLREETARLCEDLSGHRLLRGINRPGGMVLPQPFSAELARETVSRVGAQFLAVARGLLLSSAFRARTQWVGVLTPAQAGSLGVTGLVARASGIRRDFRLNHPAGVFRDPHVRRLIEASQPDGQAPESLYESVAGDTYARFAIRVREAACSVKLIHYFLGQWVLPAPGADLLEPVDYAASPNFCFGLGWAEGWRGEIVYWVMKDKFARIYRCKVRDPSQLNWPGLKAAVEPHRLDDSYIGQFGPPEPLALSTLADFPVINKSFNLSYSGNDL